MGRRTLPWTKEEMCFKVSETHIEFIKLFLFESKKWIEQTNTLPDTVIVPAVGLRQQWLFLVV